MTPDLSKLRIVWWNTRLSPPKGSPLQGDDRELVLEIIMLLLLEGADILCLGEVSSSDVEWINQNIGNTNFCTIDFTNSGTANKFNIAMIARIDKVKIRESEHIVSGFGGRNYKIAVRVECVICDNLELDLFVVHWASRLFKEENVSARDHFGFSLRQNIDQRRRVGTDNVIAIGDFNDEPYNTSVSTVLRASRDATFAATKSDLLYNPFWRKMVCSKGYVRSSDRADPTGTYFYRNDSLHKWRVFDQILLSASFIGGGDWHLSESNTDVWRYAKLVEAVMGRHSNIDHLPIVGEIRRDTGNGQL